MNPSYTKPSYTLPDPNSFSLADMTSNDWLGISIELDGMFHAEK